LWWLNLEVFGFFRYARDPASPLRFLFAPQAIWFALGVLGLIFVACASRKRLVLGSLANVAFALAGGLGYSLVSGRGALQTASLANTVLNPDWDHLAVTALVLAAFVAFLLSHVMYFQQFRARRLSLTARGPDG